MLSDGLAGGGSERRKVCVSVYAPSNKPPSTNLDFSGPIQSRGFPPTSCCRSASRLSPMSHVAVSKVRLSQLFLMSAWHVLSL